MPDGDIRDDACVQWRLQRNCAMSPRSFMLHIAALAGVVAMVGIAFCAAGYPLVLCFCAFQVAALAAAAWVHAMHAIDGERIVLTPGSLEVHATRGLRSQTFRFDPCWAWLEAARDDLAGSHPPVLCGGGLRVPLGTYAAEAQRHRFAAEFSRSLRRARSATFHLPSHETST
ncbi:DUF2244 domain-containing protein [Variovorax sp. W2I14]|uniref:DUF2244 domain-containing protein n=1 Tax=Variovorax sp. W2I14 TaxID=3042290 RepID=UPI003D25172C